MRFIVFIFLLLSFFHCPLEALSLKQNIQHARKGDFIVTSQNKNYSLFHIYDKTPSSLTIEEVTVPSSRIKLPFSWREWIKNGAPHHTSWILYSIDLATGNIKESFSVSQNGWLNFGSNESFLPTLFNLELIPVPTNQLRKVGPPPANDSIDRRPFWQPQLIVDGRVIKGVSFKAWRAQWPKDNSELSGKFVEIYLPEESEKYPSYLPYWLQVKGLLGRASLHIIDSGTELFSPASPIPPRPALGSNQSLKPSIH